MIGKSETTPSMIDAGVAVLRKHLDIEDPMDSGFDRDLCIDIFIAMRDAGSKVDPTPLPERHEPGFKAAPGEPMAGSDVGPTAREALPLIDSSPVPGQVLR